MRRFAFVVFAVVGFGSGIAVAEDLKAPSCDTKARGIIWNFGSDASPDLRRCDGISYIPWGAPAPTAVQTAHPFGDLSKSCASSCMTEKRSCEAQCAPSFLDDGCKNRCARVAVQCQKGC